MTEVSRRAALTLGTGTLAYVALTGMPVFASATDEMIAAVTGGAEAVDGGIDVIAPEIAENGNTVPIEVSAASAASITILATGNPNPGVATFNFGPLAGSRSASTRIRLARTQDVIAVAQMEDGTFRKASANVKVTIGGCGG